MKWWREYYMRWWSLSKLDYVGLMHQQFYLAAMQNQLLQKKIGKLLAKLGPNYVDDEDDEGLNQSFDKLFECGADNTILRHPVSAVPSARNSIIDDDDEDDDLANEFYLIGGLVGPPPPSELPPPPPPSSVPPPPPSNVPPPSNPPPPLSTAVSQNPLNVPPPSNPPPSLASPYSSLPPPRPSTMVPKEEDSDYVPKLSKLDRRQASISLMVTSPSTSSPSPPSDLPPPPPPPK
eukprot:TRINITY_DN1901_c0_g1_i1.p2 TRINITY_DN1901_c0_g1~~TRINITY_DN1901_c0_g1_i1.p2  ORF type:complete len:234 (-),score=89.65 TRINITY_DN1901_c0_g1_i1:104-805(-)